MGQISVIAVGCVIFACLGIVLLLNFAGGIAYLAKPENPFSQPGLGGQGQ